MRAWLVGDAWFFHKAYSGATQPEQATPLACRHCMYCLTQLYSRERIWHMGHARALTPVQWSIKAIKGMAGPQVSGLNLLKYNAGVHGAPCYHRYLRGMYQLIHKNGGGLAYYGKVRPKP